MASRVNTGNRTPKQKAEDAARLATEAQNQGAQIVEEGGAKYAVTTAFGMTVKTRIA